MDPKFSVRIADTLEADILAGELLPGEHLQQEALAARFAVSRQPIRAALEILRERKLVTLRPDRSVAVEGLDRAEFGDVMATRVILETAALKAALPRLTGRDLLAARQLQERLEIEDDAAALAELDGAFHLALYKACGNRRLLELIAGLRRESRRAYLGQSPGSALRAVWNDDHHALLAACEEGDIADAEDLLNRHLERAKQRCPKVPSP